MRKLFSFLIVVFLILEITLSAKVNAEAVKIGGEGYQCVSDENRWKTEDSNVATLPSGYGFETIVVKAGQDCIPVYPTNTADTCYSVSIVGNTATVTKIGSGSSCKDISHLEGTYSIVPTPTLTPTPSVSPSPTESPTPTPSDSPTPTLTATPTVTPTLTPTPSEEVTPSPTPTVTLTLTPTPINECPEGQVFDSGLHICVDCDGGGTCEVIIGSPTATPSPTSTPTQTPTSPTPTGQILSAASTSIFSEKQGEVLGTTTLAETGSFKSDFATGQMWVGFLLSSVGLFLYGKRKFQLKV